MLIFVAGYIVPKGYSAITVFPFVFVSSPAALKDKVLVNHERIHLKQQAELLVLPFFLWYFAAYLLKLLRFRNHNPAYRNISFEREAYANEHNMDYPNQRKFWNFLEYID